MASGGKGTSWRSATYVWGLGPGGRARTPDGVRWKRHLLAQCYVCLGSGAWWPSENARWRPVEKAPLGAVLRMFGVWGLVAERERPMASGGKGTSWRSATYVWGLGPGGRAR